MPKDFFEFQQFKIHQGRSAMKVTSEACFLGAWFAAKPLACNRILDIGAGTGLLMLMLAQKHHCPIDGIELDEASAAECHENLAASPWRDRLKVFVGNVSNWANPFQYDFIISNPPFYQHSLLRDDARMNDAMHGISLNLKDLAFAIDRVVSPIGRCGLILPFEKSKDFESRMAGLGFGTEDRMTVCHSRRHPPMRQILCLKRGWQGKTQEDELYIEEPGALLADYYLRYSEKR